MCDFGFLAHPNLLSVQYLQRKLDSLDPMLPNSEDLDSRVGCTLQDELNSRFGTVVRDQNAVLCGHFVV